MQAAGRTESAAKRTDEVLRQACDATEASQTASCACPLQSKMQAKFELPKNNTSWSAGRGTRSGFRIRRMFLQPRDVNAGLALWNGAVVGLHLNRLA